MKRLLLLSSLSVALVSQAAFGESAPTIEVFASPAPNAFGSPSFAGWGANAITALENNLTSVGNPATDPTAYYQVTQGTDTSNIVTSFNSWNGLANPTGAFSLELGNRLHFGVDIEGNGNKISLSELSYDMSSSDPGNTFTDVGSFSAADMYSQYRVGVIDGPSGPTFVTSGAATQQVDQILYVGVGNALANAGCPGSDQSTLDCVAAEYDALGNFSITTDYTLNYGAGQSVDGSATVDFAAPEPGTFGLLGMGFAGLALLRNRRRQSGLRK